MLTRFFTKPRTVIYRAVDDVELAIIKSKKRFSLEPGGAGLYVKYFAKSINDANWYGKGLYKDGYTIVQGKFTGSLSKFWHPNKDIGAYVIPKSTLNQIKPVFKF